MIGPSAIIGMAAAAHRTSAVRGVDQRVVRQFENLFPQAVVEQAGEFLRRVRFGKIGPPDVADEQECRPVSTAPGVSPRSRSVTTTLTLSRVWPGVCKKPQAHLTEFDLVAFLCSVVRKRRAGAFTQIDGSAGTGSQFLVAGDEIGVQVGFDDVLDAQPALRSQRRDRCRRRVAGQPRRRCRPSRSGRTRAPGIQGKTVRKSLSILYFTRKCIRPVDEMRITGMKQIAWIVLVASAALAQTPRAVVKKTPPPPIDAVYVARGGDPGEIG